ncbi:unnamed protein product [Auanema sp. JU1783]|nr:unnamed protein product [Auanema sp. JU1783]
MLFPLIFYLFLLRSEAKIHNHDVYWNSSNPLFEPFDNVIDSPGYYEISAHPGDQIRFHCPPPGDNMEYTIIYQVPYDDFLHCVLSSSAKPVAHCKKSGHRVTHHTLRRTFYDSSNFYITTSSGQLNGMNNRRLGLCLEKNMRLAVSFGRLQMKPFEEGLYGIELDEKRMRNQNLYLVEENGSLSWKKNVHPAIERELDLEMIEKQRTFESSGLIEPIPFTDDFVNKLEEYRRRHELNIARPSGIRKSQEEMEDPNGAGLSFISFNLIY